MLCQGQGAGQLPFGMKTHVVTTKGVDLGVEFVDGTTTWVLLKDLKEFNPIRTAEFTVSRYNQNKPAFAWWVTHVLRERTAIIK